ncbi:MAG: alpha/beta hydrolase [Bacteroidia bacterium]|nr:alpha/beta hydrolase [Bacteroidia bacterium]
MKLIGQYMNLLALEAPTNAGRFVLALFCRPFRGKITDRQKQFLNSGNPFTITHEKETITCYAWGTGEKKVLLIHGWQSHSYRWKVYIDHLVEQGYKVYAFDAPGHGLSTGNFLSVPLYSEVIEKMILRIGKPDAIVAHSIGGFASLYTLHRNPSLSSKLILMAAPGEAAEFFNFYKTSLGLSKRSVDLTIKRFEERFKKSPDYFSSPAFASTLTTQGLIIHDEEDDETSVEHSKRVHAKWENSRLLITKGFGHNLKSIEVVKEVVQFINLKKIKLNFQP